jgi:hypothetical protein
MNYIAISAPVEAVAREFATSKAGYRADSIGRLVHVHSDRDSSRQKDFVFETSNDVTRHPDFVKATLSDRYEIDAGDGPILVYGPDVTAGG